MKLLDNALLDDLTEQARVNPRLHKNFNLHASYAEPSQRLLNALEPGSYIRPHRHLRDPKPECFLGIRGKLALIVFNDEGIVEGIFLFGPNEECAGADLPSGIWHTVVSLEAGSIFFETKPGPFIPIYMKDMAPWAPEEGSLEAMDYLNELKSRVLARGRSENLACHVARG
jgi:cupin fold WbuC family metalloprotein